MRFDLAAMARRAGVRKPVTIFRPIITTTAQATDLAAISHRILAPWYGAAQRFTEAYDRELARVQTHDDIADLVSLISEITDEVERLVLELTPSLREWAFRTESWHRDKWRTTVLSGAKVDVAYLIGPQDAQEAVGAFLARNVSLIRDTSAQARGRVADVVLRGLQARTSAREVGKQIAEATGMARKRATNIARDQATKLSAALDDQRQREAGLEFFRYRHSAKMHPRSWHLHRDGKIYERDTGREVAFVNGEKRYGDDEIADNDRPGIPPFCGCVAEGVLVLDGAIL